MKVFVYIKIKEHPNPESGGSNKGDIVYIYPMVEDQGKLTLDSFIPVVMDLNIPCGPEVFTIKNGYAQWNCSRCEMNTVDQCDNKKYCQAVWSAGDLFNPPKAAKNRKYNIDRSLFISAASEALITKNKKDNTDKDKIFSDSKKNEQLKSIISDKIQIIDKPKIIEVR